MSRLLWLLRRVSPLLVLVIFAPSAVHHATGQPFPLPGPAGPPAATTGVVFVQFPEDGGGGGNNYALSAGQ